jgi:putative hydrolase
MSNFGFGFGAEGSSEPGGSGGDPDDLASKIPLFAELQKLLSGGGGPVNWDLARQLAISSLASGHRSVTASDLAAVADSLRLADLWLDEVTDLPSGLTGAEAWSQVDWVEKTITTWAALSDPVAGRVVSAMSSALPPEVAAQAGPMAPMMAQLGGLMFGAQLGQGLAALAGEVVSSTDVGLPLGPTGVGALVVSNLDELAKGLERPVADVRLFTALREAAHHRLFSHVPWLRQQVVEAVDAYGRGITIDPEAITSALNEIDPGNPESLQNALAGGVFEPQNTDAQNAALRRLETLLALIEGWVDTIVNEAAVERMRGAVALSEAVRRRRASGGPAEQTFSTLVGLELRPRRLRDAAALWSAMTEQHGSTVRDSLWNHPDLLPTPDDLDDPAGFAASYGTAAELEITDFTTSSVENQAAADAQNSEPVHDEPPSESQSSDDSKDDKSGD